MSVEDELPPLRRRSVAWAVYAHIRTAVEQANPAAIRLVDLEAATDASRSSVCRAVRALVAARKVTVIHGGGRGMPSRYSIPKLSPDGTLSAGTFVSKSPQ